MQLVQTCRLKWCSLLNETLVIRAEAKAHVPTTSANDRHST